MKKLLIKFWGKWYETGEYTTKGMKKGETITYYEVNGRMILTEDVEEFKEMSERHLIDYQSNKKYKRYD